MSDRPLEAKAPPAEASRDLPYRQGVGIMLINRQGRVFVAQRIDMPSVAWQMPQGGIDKGESPLEAAWRELGEETGTDKAEVIGESRDWYVYDLPVDLAPRLWRGRFRGQTQKWFVFRFLGCDEDIDIATEKPEFSDWKWADMADLPELIVPFKRTLYTQLIAELGHFASADPTDR
jgi:putative (di)nucleoside polyphosphate hydrolase